MDKIYSHLFSIFTENHGKRKVIQGNTRSTAQHTKRTRITEKENTFEEDIRGTAQDTHEIKTKQNCTSHSNFTYAHIVKNAFVTFIVPYRYLNTC